MSDIEFGSKLLIDAVNLENERKYSESYAAYTRGLQIYMDYLKVSNSSEETKAVIRERMFKLIQRAEIVKSKLNDASDNQPNQTLFHEEIQISEDATGYGYERIFEKALGPDVRTVHVEEPYLKMIYQLTNLLRFFELLVKKCKKLKKITVTTLQLRNQKEKSEVEPHITQIEESLRDHGIILKFIHLQDLHDRKISFDNGWVVKMGRGLHYFKARPNKMSIGAYDYDLAPCHLCNIDIFRFERSVL